MMDARIGELNGGKFYAYANGYSAEPTTGTLAEVQAALAAVDAISPTQAKKIAERAGLACQWHAIGKVWVIVNKYTGERFPFDSKALKARGGKWFTAQVERVKSGESLRLFNVKDDFGNDYGNVRAIDTRAACDQVAMQFGYESEHAWNAALFHAASVVGLGGPDHCTLTATEV